MLNSPQRRKSLPKTSPGKAASSIVAGLFCQKFLFYRVRVKPLIRSLFFHRTAQLQRRHSPKPLRATWVVLSDSVVELRHCEIHELLDCFVSDFWVSHFRKGLGVAHAA